MIFYWKDDHFQMCKFCIPSAMLSKTFTQIRVMKENKYGVFWNTVCDFICCLSLGFKLKKVLSFGLKLKF